MSDHTADLLALQHWRARAAELEQERDEARALLKSCRPYVETMSLPPLSPLDKTWVGARGVLARLDALLGGRDE